jgi:CubicO group peptidase (beta-lactamase class C family)
MPLHEALARELVEPLGLDGAWLGCPPDARYRLAELILPRARPKGVRSWPRKALLLGVQAVWSLVGVDATQRRDALVPAGLRGLLNSPRLLDAELPALNGVFTARALARVYTMLACEGTIDGVRYLSPQRVREASKVQGKGLDAVLGIPMAWRLGYHLVGTSRGVVRGAFGHFGYGGSGAFADPRRGLAVAMTVNRVSGTPVGDRRMVRIAAAAVRAADRRADKLGRARQ